MWKTITISLCAFFCLSNLNAATIAVTSLNNSGSGTLREAITNAVFDDIIQFNSALSGSIVLQSALPDITVRLTINGPSSGLVTLDGNDLYPLFIAQTDSFFVNKLNLSNGVRAGGGGAVFVDLDHFATLSNLNVTLSAASDGLNPLFADVGGQLILNNVTFSSSNTSEVYLNTGNLAINNTSTTDTIVGGSGVVVTDGDAVNMFTPTASSGEDLFILVVSGTTSFTGTTVEPLIILSNGTLSGDYTIGYLANYGICQMGDSSTITQCQSLNGSILDSQGTLQVKIDSAGNSDQLANGGLIILNGTLELRPSSGTYSANTIYTIVTSDAFILGAFDIVTPFNGLDFQVNYNSNSVEIEILTTSTI